MKGSYDRRPVQREGRDLVVAAAPHVAAASDEPDAAGQPGKLGPTPERYEVLRVRQSERARWDRSDVDSIAAAIGGNPHQVAVAFETHEPTSSDGLKLREPAFRAADHQSAISWRALR